MYESLGAKSETVKQVYPRMLYGRAVEHINDQQLVQADNLLDKLIAAPYNTPVLQFAYFWKGEIALRNNNPDAAIEYFNNYLLNPISNGDVNVTDAKYNLGFAYFTKENYRQALSFFEQVTKTVSSASSPIQQDAYIQKRRQLFYEPEL